MSQSGNFFALLEKKLKAAGDAPAFETADGAILTFARLLDEVGRAAAALISLGVARGDRVLAQADKSLANVFLYLATLKIGAVFNPLNTAYTAAELVYFIGDAEPTVIVVAPERVAEIKRASKANKVRCVAYSMYG
jgi:malonyl-CoA/methylmalonyl-CoA synthetase